MPTLVITGHPSAGKSRFARILAERALAQPKEAPGAGTSRQTTAISTVVLISEDTACPGRTKSECYATSKAEKVTREALKSTFDKYCTSSGGDGSGGAGSGTSGGGGSGIVLHRKDADGNAATTQNTTTSSRRNSNESRLVILDSLNYIKGFRYEIHCIAKASGQRHGVVWVLNDPDKCLEWNDQRRRRQRKGKEKSDATDDDGENSTAAEDWYEEDDMIRELMRRYEPPDERNRWDKPLYRADIGSILLAKADGKNETQGSATTTSTKHEGANSASANPDGDGSAKNMSSSADAVLSRTLYDMHCLTEAIGGDTTTSTTTAAQTDAKATAQHEPASKSFKRSAAAGFKRNKARSATATAAASKERSTTGASEGVAILQLTPEALESLDASNDGRNNTGGTSTTDGQSIDNKGEEDTKDNARYPAKNVGGVNSTVNNSATGTEPTTLEELADSILNSFLGKDVIPLKEGMSTALLVNAGANVSQVYYG